MSAEGAALTLLDRAVAWFSPATGVERLRARRTMSALGGYKSARRDRRATKRWQPGGSSADADTLPDVPELRARSRDLARNMPLATGALATTVTHVVGLGLTPHAAVDREALGLSEDQAATWERSAEREFRTWAKRADLGETLTFDAVQELVLRSALESGDVLLVRRFRQRPGSRYGLRLQIVEADRLSNPQHRGDSPELAGGVQLDGDGRPVAYHVATHHPGDRLSATHAWTALPADYADGRPVCLHVVDRQRPGQTRGVPFLAPVIEALKELENFTEAELRAAVVSALFTVFIEHEQEVGSTIVDQMQEQPDGSGDLELKAGAILDLGVGEKANVANPGRPNPQFDPFVMAVLRQIGVALELPFELLIKHFTASYSASRAALEMAHLAFSRRRKWLVRTLCRPVWEMVIEEAVATGRLHAPGFFEDPLAREAWLGCDWIGPSRISLDPLKDARADMIDMSSGAKTLQQVCSERTGGDWERKTSQRAKEVRARSAAGLNEPTGGATDGSPAESPPAPAARPETDEEDDDDA
jgi:lambda family phage portal protein